MPADDTRPYPFISTDITGAATATGLSPASIRAAIASGDLTAHYHGSKPLIRAEDLDEWVEDKPTSRPSERLAG